MAPLALVEVTPHMDGWAVRSDGAVLYVFPQDAGSLTLLTARLAALHALDMLDVLLSMPRSRV